MTKLKFSRQRVNSIVVEEEKERFTILVNENIFLSVRNSNDFLRWLKSSLKEEESSELMMNYHGDDLTVRHANVSFHTKGEFIELDLL